MLVDLPGVADANTARGSIARKHMERCSAIWIVADINRAVDNFTARVSQCARLVGSRVMRASKPNS